MFVHLRATILLFATLSAATHGGSVVDVGSLQIHVCSDAAVRITCLPPGGAATAPKSSFSIVADCENSKAAFSVSTEGDITTVKTERLQVRVDRSHNDRIEFLDARGATLLREPVDGARVFDKTTDLGAPGQDAWSVRQRFEAAEGESIYGWGQYQNGFVDYSRAAVQLAQSNLEDGAPVLVGTRGWQLIWDNAGRSVLNLPDKTEEVVLRDGAGNGKTKKGSWEAKASGTHHIYVDMRPEDPDGWGPIADEGASVSVDGVKAFEYSTCCWDTPATMSSRLEVIKPGVKQVTMTSQPNARLYILGPDRKTNDIWSRTAKLIDYYFVAAGGMDGAVSEYRKLTGAAPMLARSALGFWQCRERYHTQDELMDAAKEYRRRQIPVDNIVQDWHYWGDIGWGPQWDPAYYPDPKLMVDTVHKLNMSIMVSVWSKFDTNTRFFKEMDQLGYMIPTNDSANRYFDAYNPKAREMFYNYVKNAMFDLGFDYIWLDATEPELYPTRDHPVYLGSGNAYTSAYAFFVTQSMYEGHTRDFPEKRFMTLTRSLWLGQQRFAGSYWSGDTTTSWDNFKRQISAGINYCYTGFPYWTQDIGGFFRPGNQYADKGFHELLTRWFQFGAFNPIYRVHGSDTRTEVWNFGDEVLANVLKMTNLRYRLLPYIYSLAHRVTAQHYTIMRGLVFDFADDLSVRRIADQYMFGPSILVSPVIEQGALKRDVYLPRGKGVWVDFWTGEALPEGKNVIVAAPLDRLPLHVPAASVIPMGPLLQYSWEKKPDPLEIRIYPGVGQTEFEVYEDDFETTAYATKGESATFVLKWNSATRVLNIGRRTGYFPGMLETRTINIVLVGPGRGVGVGPTENPDATVTYNGLSIDIKL